MLYGTLGPTLPDGAQAAAALWGLAHRCAMTYPDAVRRAGHADGEALFDAILAAARGHRSPSTSTRTTWSYVAHPDKRIALDDPRAARRAARRWRDARPGWTSDEFPFVLSAGERRSFTANTIFRDPTWRKRDADGALRISREDAGAARARPTAGARASRPTRGSAEALGRGHRRDAAPGTSRCPTASALDYPARTAPRCARASRRTS